MDNKILKPCFGGDMKKIHPGKP